MPAKRQGAIVVRGARVHNLKNITVEIPLGSLTVITGVSGSGKSSLAFDTLYAEGQRRYVASLSAYARQFLERISRPDVDDIEGICPALALRQKSYSRNPRSTVATVTEIYDYLRLLYARVGVTLCHSCGRPVEKDSPERIADFVMKLPQGTRFYVCLPLESLQLGDRSSRRRKPKSRASSRPAAQSPNQPAAVLQGLRQQGFARVLIGDQLLDLAQALLYLEENSGQPVRVVVDRLAVGDDIRSRLIDSLEICGRESEGRIELVLLSPTPAVLETHLASNFPEIRFAVDPAGVLVRFSERFECQLCHITYEPPEPRLFSFNNPYGACPDCQGFGNTITLDLDRVVPDTSKTLAEGAVDPWTKPRYRSFHGRLIQFAQCRGIPVDVPWAALPEKDRDLITRGGHGFGGILGFFDDLEQKKYKMHVRIFISRYRGYATCLTCHGERLRQEARDVFVAGKPITEITRMTIRQAHDFFDQLQLSAHQASIASKVLDEIRHRLDLLLRVGLDYITLDRLSSTLSGGESQRIQLATSLGSTLVGALYVLDEPSIGLHARDSRRLVEILKSLKTLGNTVVVVEHDPEIMGSADHLIDLGPRAGEEGGRVIYQGDFDSILDRKDSLTARYLKGELRVPVPIFRRKGNGQALEIINSRMHNLKHLNIRIPLGVFVCIAGVSGSGKSTLVHDVLYPAIRSAKGNVKDQAADGYDSLLGAQHISDAVLVDQSPIGRTPRSNPVTYIKAFDEIRAIFGATRDAVARNLRPSHFSFNLAGGRCETCQGSGTITVEMQFLADVELVCEDCKGSRFKGSVLEVKYKGKNIAEVLDLTVHEAIEFYAGHPTLTRKLRLLEEIGLGYLRLGQSATSLSGGEAQRIKLASFISHKSASKTLYIFDEPTTGLHFDDVRKLLAAFDKLINAGNSVLVIEHNLDVIKTADWVIDLGPEGGDAGGRIVFEGSPDDLLKCKESYTGQFLQKYLARSKRPDPAPQGTPAAAAR